MITGKQRPENTMLTYERAAEMLSYDPETGFLTWNESPGNRVRRGGRVGTLSVKGYLTFCLDGASYKVHRVAWLLSTGQWPKDQIDHVNGDRADNRLANLREATNAENCQNQRRRRNNTSGYSGVTYVTRDRRWVAQLQVDGKQVVVGRFATKEEAAKCRLEAEKIHYPFRWAA